MHGQPSVGVVPPATAAASDDALDSLEAALQLGRLRLAGLVVEGGDRLGQDAGLQDGATVVAGAVVVVALADDLATFDDDAAMAVVERR